MSREYEATDLASAVGCNLATQDCIVDARVIWRPTKLGINYWCNGGKITQTKYGDVNTSWVNRTDNGTTPCLHEEDFSSYDWPNLGVRDHSYSTAYPSLYMVKSDVTTTIYGESSSKNWCGYYYVGSANSSHTLCEQTTFSDLTAFVQATQNFTGTKYYDDWKHSDVNIDLYAQYGCVSTSGTCAVTNHSWNYNGA